MSQKTKKTKKTKRSSAKVRLSATTLAILSGLSAYQVMHAVAATATLQIIAELVRAVELTISTTLDFGVLAMTADRGGRAVIDPEINQLFIDDSSSLSLAGGEPRAGRVLVKGAEFPMAISLDDTVVKLTNGGTGTLEISNFNLLTAKGGTKITFTPTRNNSSFVFPVGATIKTRKGQLSGTYVGSTRIFASYQ